jgi:2-octaprenylphenol hydroxylase
MGHTSDIVIVGGGIVGMTVALALARQTAMTITVLEAAKDAPSWSSDEYYPRVSALSLSSQRIFQALEVWQDIQSARVSPFRKIEVWNAQDSQSLLFDSQDLAEKQLGFIVENALMQTALRKKIQRYPTIRFFSGMQLQQYEEKINLAEVTAASGERFSAKLFVAADGAHSWLRSQQQFEVRQKKYEQSAIVAAVETELPHQAIARQIFLPSGPLAFLPLSQTNMTSIVWSLPTAEAHRIHALNDAAFYEALGQAFGFRLGNIMHAEKRFLFPLKRMTVSSYFKSRVVLAGDAAHMVHPLAGQGLNIGLLDAAALTEVIKNAYQKRRDFASYNTLRRYERWRKAENLPMLEGVDFIKTLFAIEKPFLREMVTAGLAVTHQWKWLKNQFAQYAIGKKTSW